MSLESQHTSTIHVPVKPELPAKEEGGLLVLNGTMIVIAVSFIIFTVLMQKILYGPVMEIMRKRKEHIKKMKTEADAASLEAAKLDENYHETIKNTRREVSEKTTVLLSEANEEKNKLLSEKKQELNGFLNDQKQVIQSEKDQAIDSLRGQVMDYAYRISCKVLGEGVSMEGISPEIVDKALN